MLLQFSENEYYSSSVCVACMQLALPHNCFAHQFCLVLSTRNEQAAQYMQACNVDFLQRFEERGDQRPRLFREGQYERPRRQEYGRNTRP